MDLKLKDRIYFESMKNYEPKGIKTVYPVFQDKIYSACERIKDIARDALSEEISTKNAKKEISNLLDNIKQFKQEGK